MGTKFIREAKALVPMSLDGTAGVTINGEQRRVAPGTSLAQLIAEVGLDPRRVAVERNLEIIPRSTFGEVVVEDGDARRWAGGLAKEPGCRQTADPRAHDDEIVALARVDRRARGRPEAALAHRVRDLERAVVAAAQTGPRRWIGASGVVEAPAQRVERRQQRVAGRKRHAVQEVAAGEPAHKRSRAERRRTPLSALSGRRRPGRG